MTNRSILEANIRKNTGWLLNTSRRDLNSLNSAKPPAVAEIKISANRNQAKPTNCSEKHFGVCFP